MECWLRLPGKSSQAILRSAQPRSSPNSSGGDPESPSWRLPHDRRSSCVLAPTPEWLELQLGSLIVGSSSSGFRRSRTAGVYCLSVLAFLNNEYLNSSTCSTLTSDNHFYTPKPGHNHHRKPAGFGGNMAG
ncbi:hypothetical protein GUJ93_ZPchr0002g24667 [Zizania palustris]|uniref:Uncharacterized protein n=1 Tax=Zizania palustris TaxID=103762 RepID=A0A8J5RVT3_ZIZPA|nr:hypothetical protein GUJ93_ZPchr0002g24667 [Zizania palustris]